jgi:hypothetical protein
MAALLAERPRTGHTSEPLRAPDESDSGWLRRLRERREEERAGAPDVAVDPAPTRDASSTPHPPLDSRGLPPVPGRRYVDEDDDDLLPMSAGIGGRDDDPEPDGDAAQARRRRLVVVGLPLLALVVVIALAVWLGNVISPDDVAGDQASAPTAPSSAPAAEDTPPGEGSALTITGGSVYNPQGDGEPENPDEVPLSFDGDPATGWSTVTYRGSPAFGNLKDGVGVLYDLGSEQALAGLGVTGSAGATVEVRAGDQPDGDLDSYAVVASGELGSDELTFDEPVTTRYVLLWVTGLVPSDGGFSAEITEVSLTPAG